MGTVGADPSVQFAQSRLRDILTFDFLVGFDGLALHTKKVKPPPLPSDGQRLLKHNHD